MGSEPLVVPPTIVDKLGEFQFHLDFYGAPEKLIDAVLVEPWQGRVFLAPGYSGHTRKLLTRMANHNHGTVFIGARPETALFQRYVFGHATAVLFIEGRVSLVGFESRLPVTSSAAPTALVAYGEDDAMALRRADIVGTFVWTEAAKRTGERTLT